MKIGTATTIISPPLPIQLAGHKGERIGTAVGDDLFAKAIALSENDITLIIISIDLLWLDRSHVSIIRELIREVVDIPTSNILVACTHTHSGPDTLDWYDFAPPVDQEWLALLLRRIASTGIDATLHCEEASIDSITSSVPIAMNRRLRDEEGRIRLRPNPDGPTDQRFTIIRFRAHDDRIIATILHHAVHPVVLGADSLRISGDWCGVACSLVEKQLGCTALFLNGAAGDQNPTIWTGRSYDEMQQMAERVAAAALELIDTPFAAEQNQTLGALAADLRVASTPHPYLIKAQGRRSEPDGTITFEVQAMKIGPITLVTSPGECLIDTGKAIVEPFTGQPVLIVSYANDYIGYLPLPHIFDEGGYEPSATMISATGVIEYVGLARRLVREIHARVDYTPESHEGVRRV